jgi:small subunit ribosomal protein S6
MVSTMSFYEHTIIAKQDISTPEIEKVEKKYKDIINETEGEVIKVEKWGLLSFAKKIRSYNKGFYIHYKFKGESKTLEEIKKNCVIDNSLLRYLTVRYKKLDTETEYFKEKDSNEKKK